jgi:hypothetical protein
MLHTKKDEKWYDETGMAIPRSRVTALEKMKESTLAKIVKEAQALEGKLTQFKALMKEGVGTLYDESMKENNVKTDAKGNFTIFSFDRSIKIEVSIADRITFDDLTIKAAQEKLNEFLKETVESKYDFVKDLVTEAFSTSRGSLDAKKVTGLLKYAVRINHPLFQEACTLIQKAIVRPDSKTYYRVFVKDEEGKYKNIELNFSNI